MADGTVTAPPKLEVTAEFPRDPRLFKREHERILRDTLRNAAEEHHRRHIPRHFQAFAVAKYGYTPRSRRYQALKRRLGINEPLVSGMHHKQGRPSTKEVVTKEKTITATQHKATLTMRVPITGGTGSFRFRQGQRELTRSQRTMLRIILEIKAIAADERRYLADFIRDRYTAAANQPGTKYRSRRRGG